MNQNSQFLSSFCSMFGMAAILLIGIGVAGFNWCLRMEYTQKSPYMLVFGCPVPRDILAYYSLLVDIYKGRGMPNVRPWLLAGIAGGLLIFFIIVFAAIMICLSRTRS